MLWNFEPLYHDSAVGLGICGGMLSACPVFGSLAVKVAMGVKGVCFFSPHKWMLL